MKIIPKYQAGGYSWMFNTFNIVQPQQLQGGSAAASAKEKSDDGELKEKDFFDMVKDLDGLPNEMQQIISKISGVFRYKQITGESVQDLSIVYLDALYDLQVAKQNKDHYDKALEAATTNGALNEPAITPAGNILIQNDDGSLGEVAPEDLLADMSNYHVLTVSQLMNMRAYNSMLAGDQKAFNIAQNSMGYESFDALLDKALERIGSTLTSNDTREALDPTATVEKIRQLGEQGVDYYSLKDASIDQDSKAQIENLLTYMIATMPKSARTWAMLKTGINDEVKALHDLAFQYLSGKADEIHRNTKYTDPKTSKNGSSSNGDNDNLEAKFWYNATIDQVGDTRPFLLMVGNSNISIGEAKYNRVVPGFDKGDQSLAQFITNSGIGYVSGDNIAFGNRLLSEDGQQDVMIDTNKGSYIVELPIVLGSGIPDLDIMNRYAEAKSDIVKEGENVDIETIHNILIKHNLEQFYDSTSHDGWNHNMMGHFVVLQGIAPESVQIKIGSLDRTGVTINQNMSLQTVLDNSTQTQREFYRDIHATQKDYDRLNTAKISYGNRIPGRDTLYRAQIFIPIYSNGINSALADSTKQTRGSSHIDAANYQENNRTGKKMNVVKPDVSKPFIWYAEK